MLLRLEGVTSAKHEHDDSHAAVRTLPPRRQELIWMQEAIMSATNYPTKQQVRDWLSQRLQQHKPLPDIKQIRRELGWDLLKTSR